MDDSRAEKGDIIDGNSSNKERNGRCVVSEAEQGAALDAVFMDIDPFRISKGGNPNFCSDHKPPSEPEIAENLVTPPCLHWLTRLIPKEKFKPMFMAANLESNILLIKERPTPKALWK
ncbi:hypothetical protein U1Q18_035166 [Sarracenia purpurea var. burkii]